MGWLGRLGWLGWLGCLGWLARWLDGCHTFTRSALGRGRRIPHICRPPERAVFAQRSWLPGEKPSSNGAREGSERFKKVRCVCRFAPNRLDHPENQEKVRRSKRFRFGSGPADSPVHYANQRPVTPRRCMWHNRPGHRSSNASVLQPGSRAVSSTRTRHRG
jgi:hypothetical protein